MYERETIEQLARVMRANGLTGLEWTEEGCTLKLSMAAERKRPPCRGPWRAETAAEIAPVLPAEAAGPVIKAPMVGMAYLAGRAGAAPFVTVGDRVKKGDVVCIIEAMKLMNEITAEEDGEIAEVCVQNGQVVEFGQPLFRLR